MVEDWFQVSPRGACVYVHRCVLPGLQARDGERYCADARETAVLPVPSAAAKNRCRLQAVGGTQSSCCCSNSKGYTRHKECMYVCMHVCAVHCCCVREEVRISFNTRTHSPSSAAPSSTTATPPRTDLPTWSFKEAIQPIVPCPANRAVSWKDPLLQLRSLAAAGGGRSWTRLCEGECMGSSPGRRDHRPLASLFYFNHGISDSVLPRVPSGEGRQAARLELSLNNERWLLKG